MLLQMGRVGVDAKDTRLGRTTLRVARNGYKIAFKLLLDIIEAEFNPKNISGGMPLSCAVENEHLTVAKLLLHGLEKNVAGSFSAP